MTAPIEIPGYVVSTWDLGTVHSHIGFVGRHLWRSLRHIMAT